MKRHYVCGICNHVEEVDINPAAPHGAPSCCGTTMAASDKSKWYFLPPQERS